MQPKRSRLNGASPALAASVWQGTLRAVGDESSNLDDRVLLLLCVDDSVGGEFPGGNEIRNPL